MNNATNRKEGNVKEGVNRGIIKAAGVIGSTQMVNIVCSLVRSKIVAIFLGPAGVGVFGLFTGALELLTTIGSLGLRPSAVRDLGSCENRRLIQLAKAVRTIANWLGVIGGIATMILSPILSLITFGSLSWWWGFALLGIVVFLNVAVEGEFAIFQGLKQFKHLARCSMIGYIGGCVITIPLIYLMGMNAIVPSIIAYSLCLYLATRMRRTIGPDLPTQPLDKKETIATARRMISFGKYITIASVLTFGANYLFMVYINNTGSEADVGFFHAGNTLVNRFFNLMFAAVSIEYLPRLASHAASTFRTRLMVSNQIFLLNAVLAGVVPLFIVAAPWLLQLFYTSEFYGAIPLMTLAATSTLFKGISWCMATEIMARGDGHTFFITEIISTTLYLTLSVVGYHTGGFVGLGASMIVWYMAYTAMIWGVFRWRYRIRLAGPQWGSFTVTLLFTLPCVAAALWGHQLWAAPVALAGTVYALIWLRRHYTSSR